ncbi:MAG: cation transporter [Actinobacteria bacterium]|nr:cation transporter [Actinomycetota bacterium]MCL5447059.1 cation transporter [Actinomycetota bacterium]
MPLIEISVPGISCAHCKSSIEGALRPVAGVDQAVVDVSTKTVAVSYGSPATLDAITEVIENQGYDVASYEELESRQ